MEVLLNQLYEMLKNKSRKAFSFFKKNASGNQYEAFRRMKPTSKKAETYKLDEYIVIRNWFWSKNRYKIEKKYRIKNRMGAGYYPVVAVIGLDDNGRFFCHRLPFRMDFLLEDEKFVEKMKRDIRGWLGFDKHIWEDEDPEDCVRYRVQGDIVFWKVDIPISDFIKILGEMIKDEKLTCINMRYYVRIKNTLKKKINEKIIVVENEKYLILLFNLLKEITLEYTNVERVKNLFIRILQLSKFPLLDIVEIIDLIEKNNAWIYVKNVISDHFNRHIGKRLYGHLVISMIRRRFYDFVEILKSILVESITDILLELNYGRKIKMMKERAKRVFPWEIEKLLRFLTKFERRYRIIIGNHEINLIGIGSHDIMTEKLTKDIFFRLTLSYKSWIYRIAFPYVEKIRKDIPPSNILSETHSVYMIIRPQEVLFLHDEHKMYSVKLGKPRYVTIVKFDMLRAHPMHERIRRESER